MALQFPPKPPPLGLSLSLSPLSGRFSLKVLVVSMMPVAGFTSGMAVVKPGLKTEKKATPQKTAGDAFHMISKYSFWGSMATMDTDGSPPTLCRSRPLRLGHSISGLRVGCHLNYGRPDPALRGTNQKVRKTTAKGSNFLALLLTGPIGRLFRATRREP